METCDEESWERCCIRVTEELGFWPGHLSKRLTDEASMVQVDKTLYYVRKVNDDAWRALCNAIEDHFDNRTDVDRSKIKGYSYVTLEKLAAGESIVRGHST